VLTLGNVFKEEAAPGIAALHGVGRPLADISAMEEILLKLFFGDEIRGLVTMLGEDMYCAGVVLPVRSDLSFSCRALMSFSFQFSMTIPSL
jgi:hypothetical protein